MQVKNTKELQAKIQELEKKVEQYHEFEEDVVKRLSGTKFVGFFEPLDFDDVVMQFQRSAARFKGWSFTFEKAKLYENVTTSATMKNGGSAGYEVVDTIKDLLSWNNKTLASDILCNFEADNISTAVMWQIALANISPTNEGLLRTQARALTIIPIYSFATSLEDANEYKTIQYSIQRGQGKDMGIYYCMGDKRKV